MQHPKQHLDETQAGSSTLRSLAQWPSLAHQLRTSVRLAAVTVAIAAGIWLMQPVHAQDAVHVVAGGENLSTIAKGYGMTLQELAAYNGIVNPNLVFVGQQIQIPTSGYAPQTLAPADSFTLPGDEGYHVVARGDTLSEVAKAYGMTTGDLMRLNGISNANMIWLGQQLRVTARVDAVAASTANAPQPTVADEIYVVQAGDTLAEIAARYQTTVQGLLAANGLPNPNFVWVGQQLRVRANTQPETTLSLVAAPADGQRWVEVDLTNQTLTAWQGDVPVMFTAISSGRANTPTVTGRFTIGNKYKAQRMTGPGYDLPNVPWVMYFHQGYAIHGAYWHNNFGAPMSHGCVNMRSNEAEMLYNWAAAGTEVYVHY
ncbi:LysM peptidoglycan-binding domain-containing protein [Caldilinea sp.]|uniref:LysM peptidoglycan-binding domain-containing protein n=1 Tax=Caldilinea sp. TaxID=2293560 RepID=UPI002B71C8C4|nr:LysM peptidoglycan-binding domain-containing protein [Anaerolineales bacterium]HQY92540.1 LysM peptidoglycan-binding domain-containing protein [Caldilinea sp.]HRA66674.1 LysM peptidoglycan-binding domain-containing protein [Caldilinea sp.]